MDSNVERPLLRHGFEPRTLSVQLKYRMLTHVKLRGRGASRPLWGRCKDDGFPPRMRGYLLEVLLPQRGEQVKHCNKHNG